MRIAFFGTSDFAVPILEKLVASGYQLVGVVTQPDRPAGRHRRMTPSPVKRAATAMSLRVLQPERVREATVVRQIEELQPNAIVVVAFSQILPLAILELPPMGCLNVHPSLLPRWRGASPVAGAIVGGDEETGVSIMLMDEGMDTGPLLAQRGLWILPNDTSPSLGWRLATVGVELLLETLPKWTAGRITPVPQDERQATYTRLLTKGDGLVDWRWSAEELWRRCRAYCPWPGCYTFWQGRRLKLLEVAPNAGGGGGLSPGQVSVREGDHPEEKRLVVGTGGGLLWLRQVQLEGGRPTSGIAFLRGHPTIVGAILG